MRMRLWLAAVTALVFMLGAGACRKYVTEPVTRRPVITSIVAFPTVLGPGDSTLVTVTATDPDGDVLMYFWEGWNGMIIKGRNSGDSYYSASPSMVFYRSTQPIATDTAFIRCMVTDHKGGIDARRVLIFYKD
jgi:hypothetical protein